MMHIFHCYHPTGRKAKKFNESNHGKYTNPSLNIWEEEECCKCGKIKWFKGMWVLPEDAHYYKDLLELKELNQTAKSEN